MNTHSSIYRSTKGKTGSKVQKTHFSVLAKGGGGVGGAAPPYSVCAPPCEKLPPATHFPIFVFFMHRWFIKAHLSGMKSGIRPIRCIWRGKTILESGKIGYWVTVSHAPYYFDLARTLPLFTALCTSVTNLLPPKKAACQSPSSASSRRALGNCDRMHEQTDFSTFSAKKGRKGRYSPQTQ